MLDIIQSKITWFWGYILLSLLCFMSLISPNFDVNSITFFPILSRSLSPKLLEKALDQSYIENLLGLSPWSDWRDVQGAGWSCHCFSHIYISKHVFEDHKGLGQPQVSLVLCPKVKIYKIFMPPKELWEACSNRTFHPSVPRNPKFGVWMHLGMAECTKCVEHFSCHLVHMFFGTT